MKGWKAQAGSGRHSMGVENYPLSDGLGVALVELHRLEIWDPGGNGKGGLSPLTCSS